jgi:hypothetical protein
VASLSISNSAVQSSDMSAPAAGSPAGTVG